MRDGGNGGGGVNRRGRNLLIDCEGEEKVEENKNMKEVREWGVVTMTRVVGQQRDLRVTGAGLQVKEGPSR